MIADYKDKRRARAILSLSLMKNLGAKSLLHLLKKYKDPIDVLEIAMRKTKDQKRKAVEPVDEAILDKTLEVSEKKGIVMITICDSGYPPSLRDIHVPPPVIFVRGDFSSFEGPTVAIVGTRRATPYGRRIARWLGGAMALEGVTVVSGMARGIDTESHLGCLEKGGRTIAILGTGVDVPYPRENARLMERIMECGAVVSEFPPLTMPFGANFPRRNRIISGLSRAVVVIEAPKKSGALITAGFALEQGKSVLAVPGEIDSENSKGSLALLRDGAIPVLDAQDVMDAIGWLAGKDNKGMMPSQGKPPVPPRVSSKLMDYLDRVPVHIDEISERSGLSTPEILGELLRLEMLGVVEQRPGKYYILCAPGPM